MVTVPEPEVTSGQQGIEPRGDFPETSVDVTDARCASAQESQLLGAAHAFN
jgi:hypothetical protein